MQPNAYQTYLNQNGGPSENWVERLLPTGGSILGGLAGTALGGPLGGIAGAATGSALGKGAEDAFTGKQASLGDIGGAAAEGGIGQLTGLGIGKVLGGATGLLSKIGSAGENAAADEAYTQPFKSVFGSQVGKSNNVSAAIPFMKNLGIEGDPEAWLKAASVATGNTEKSPAVMTNIVNKAVTDAGPIVGGDLTGQVNNALSESGIPLADKDAKWLAQQLDRATSSVTLDASGKPIEGPVTAGNSAGATVSQAVDPSSLFSTIQGLEKKIAPYYKPGVQLSVEDSSKLQGLENASELLKDHLYNSGVIDKTVASTSVSPEDYQKILSATGGNKALADDIASKINNATTGQELRSAQQPYVQASKIAQFAKYNNQGVNPLAPAVTSSAQDVLSPNVQALAGAAHPRLGAIASVLNMLGKTAGKAAPLAEKALPGAQAATGVLSQVGAHAPSLGAEPAQGATMQGQGNDMGPYQTAGAPMGNMGQELALASMYAPNMVPAIQQAQSAQAAQPMLQGLEHQYGQAGGAQGFGGGLLSQISSLIPGTAAYQYNQQKNQAAAAIAKATGLPLPSVLAAMPSLMADQNGAMGEFGTLQGGLNVMQQPGAFNPSGSVLGGLSGGSI